MSASAASSSSRTSVVPLKAAEIPSQVEQLISLHLHLWPALTLAIQNAWGTSSPQISADKRSWFAGAVSEMFFENQLRDLEDLEDVLEQVMFDEFEVVVDDGSLEETAEKIWRGVTVVKGGEGKEVRALLEEWEKRKGKQVVGVSQGDGEQESTDGSDDGADDMDMDMDEAPALIDSTKTKAEPEVDEDGFTKVASKKKR